MRQVSPKRQQSQPSARRVTVEAAADTALTLTQPSAVSPSYDDPLFPVKTSPPSGSVPARTTQIEVGYSRLLPQDKKNRPEPLKK